MDAPEATLPNIKILKAYPDISPTLVARHFEVSPSKIRRLRAKLNTTS